MIVNELPATLAPCKLDAGEGLGYAFGSHLATMIARPDGLGQPAWGRILSGAKGASFPLHIDRATHEAIFVVDGVIALRLAGSKYQLTPGDYINIPPGTAHGYEFLDQCGKKLTWSFGGNAAEAVVLRGKPFAGIVYPESAEAVNWSVLSSSVDTELVGSEGSYQDAVTGKLTIAPEGPLPFVLAASEGESMIAGDQVYTFLGNQSQSNGTFIALLTGGPNG